MQKPLVSIIIPCYNTAQYLDECLQSVVNQTYSNWEAIIVNDGSTDHTSQIARVWVDKDKRFQYFEKENGGLANTRIFGIEKSEGKYIFPLDSDDFIDSTFVKKAIDILEKDNSIEVVYSQVMNFGEKNGLFELEKYSLEYLLLKNCIVASAFFRRETYDKVGGYCKDLKFLEDWDLWISILKNGGNVYKIEEPLFFYRVRESGSLINNLFEDLELYKQHHDIIFKRHSDAFIKYIGNPFLIERERIQLLNYKQKIQSSFFYRNYQRLKKVFKK
ncbi:glycosyltransferase [Polaribacter aestuariivivens]|uniref:Glycosyltransferase n=1 Tax=Polaribacter aestuariivivens TaxID=2304626 RepID=A0A5S3N7R7_9FLAO|nr:glycosyltransferase [Polaribacter aestuariivivens]TMM31351.1 glycosyltransferase [Polaribacter aestuariivivens]